MLCYRWQVCQVEILRYTKVTTFISRSLKPIDQFEAIFFHQRSLDFNDVPTIRNVCDEIMNPAWANQYMFKPSQRYVHYIMESAQYLYQDISTMNNFFNWTMSYRCANNNLLLSRISVVFAGGILTSIVLTGGLWRWRSIPRARSWRSSSENLARTTSIWHTANTNRRPGLSATAQLR